MKLLIILFSSLFLFNCAPGKSTYLANPNPKNIDFFSENKIESVQIKPKVDILFVLDNSGSMVPENDEVKRNISLFIAALSQNENVDYQIAATTVYDSKHFKSPSYIKKYGSVSNGNLNSVNIKNKSTSIITPKTSSYINNIFNVKYFATPKKGEIAQGPVYEELFSPIKSALEKNPKLYRKNALLVTIIISDAETADDDISAVSLKNYLQEKTNNNFLTFAAISPSNDKGKCFKDVNTSKGIPKDPIKVERFIEITKGKIFSLCSKSFGEELANFGLEIKRKLSARSFKLDNIPDIYSLEVSINGKPLAPDQEEGWTYDEANNSVKINEKVNFKGTAVVEITYKAINANDFINKRVVRLGK